MTASRSVHRWFGLLLGATQLAGCSLGYYSQAVSGHVELMNQRRPVEEVVRDGDTPPAVRDRLAIATHALEFAHSELQLPDNGSYRWYADTGRAFVVWNVFAAPEFDLQPRTWCFPVAGCVSYRGYFAESRAREFAAGLEQRGADVFVGGVTAYSTLGRFEDPLLNTMMDLPDHRLAGLLFHELAHQQVYVPDDTAFNEGFASAVEREGIVRWLGFRNDHAGLCRYRQFLARRARVQSLLEDARTQLQTLYSSDRDTAEMRVAKAALFGELRGAYQAMRHDWAGPPYFDGWFGASLNNAQLAALATYEEYRPAFTELIYRQAGDMAAFYRRVEELAELSVEARLAQMVALRESALSDRLPGDNCPAASGSESR